MAGYYVMRMDMPNGNEGGSMVSPDEMLRDEVIGISDWDGEACEEFNEAPIGSVVLVRKGDEAIALVKIMSDCAHDLLFMQKYGFALYRHVEVLDWADSSHQPRAGLFRITGAFKHLTEPNREQYNYIHDWYNRL